MISIRNWNMLIWITAAYGVITHGSHQKRTDTSDSMSSQIYPNVTYKVNTNSGDYARVAEPLSSVQLQKLNFYFDNQDNQDSEVFGITKKGGIVFIKDAKLLQTFNYSQFTLKIGYGRDKKTEIILKLENQSDEQCKKTSHCSNIHLDTKSECTSSCGIGTVSKCQWRESPKPDTFTANYSTCTPDINTCPDGNCDSLEIINHLICPQDCTDEVFGTGKEGKTAGISRAKGVCTCDEIGKCTCETKLGPSKNQKIQNESAVHTQINIEEDTCGNWCDSNVNTSIIIVVAFVTTGLVMYFCRNRIVWILGGNKTNRNVRTLEELLPNFDQDEYQPNPVPNRDTFTINIDFDPKWEFPRSRLILEQVIGEGEFGKVLKAQAIDIPGTKGMSTVAVKTIKNDAGKTEKDDLLSEYNLLKDVNHPNVVKLLGACTTHEGPFYLIIEYAKYGSLRSYLRKSRILDNNANGLVSNTAGNFQQNESLISMAFPLYPISPRDILKFAWQISKGMAYLAELKLVHRDLAARNVLVTEDKVCKISDFGLTRDVYEDNAYFKKTKGRVPVKWMAPESLADHIYTSRSDVWSFGILLWELVTLGAVPYPGIIVQDLFKLLKEGYRMDKPNNCSVELYDIMNNCWAEDQYRRPSFKSLTTSLEDMLEKGNDYLKLDFKQIVNNMCYFMDDEELTNQNKTTEENIEGEVKYEIPKPVNEIGIAYVTMKDFIFDPEQQQAQVV
ncbi:proto-oncogene tyrosine-protein kinase receptor Ret-like isoform X1 [Metopolophium dirhodum]|uniref:proto-oncogene tyrosine-protein kinase receptor Ret-like isoform X1 n=2 Tax=Metopolophium dirhodum TaxID=44670 RepID=UPI0029901469|nr:proto-oncogene tyrosine-protein kinase receptor Ret-like isoform X1 [Metopolophium dirhodum]